MLFAAFLEEVHTDIRGTHTSAMARKANPLRFPEKSKKHSLCTFKGLQASAGAS